MSKTSKRRRSRAVPVAVEAVLRRIEGWRATRDKRTRMPEELWDAAAAMAREHGLWFVSRTLRVNYESLKRRVERAKAPRAGRGRRPAGFVEVDAGALIGPPEQAKTEVELTGADGARLTVRLGRESVDVEALAAAFWRRDR